MKFKSQAKQKVTLLAIFNIIIFLIMNLSFVTLAYINVQFKSNTQSNMDIRLLFGRLDESIEAEGDWGSSTNPYLISELRHLHNLYVLQNRAQTNLITRDSVFQVSDVYGKPLFIGGPTTSSLEEIVSIGTEQYPFVSTFRGVTTDNPNDYITLPTGEKSDTSVLGNIRINALDSQTDIGLFGNVGPQDAPEEEGTTVGYINTLLLYNIEINTSSIGGYNPSHKHFVSEAPFETNHIGILVGHAQYAKIQDVSVYYSGTNGNPTIKAFNVHSVSGVTPPAKYATSTGIVGYFEDIIISDDEKPVTSDGAIGDIGGTGAGLGLGVVYSRDLWEFMQEQTPVGPNPQNDEYSLQATFGPELYGINNSDKTYFQIGVFTFAHSMQVTKDDSLSKLWAQPNSNKWSISTSGSYNNAPVVQSQAYRYTLTQMNNTHMDRPTTSQTYHKLNTTYSNATTYRYMLTVDANVSGATKTFALIRNGATAAYKEVDTSNFVIPASELQYYTFDSYYGQRDNPLVPPYGSDGKELFNKRTESLQFNQNNSTTNIPMQYLGYGKDITKNGIIKEIPRPLRILFQNPGTSTSFMASSTTTGNTEGVRFIPVRDNNNTLYAFTNARPDAVPYSTYVLQRRFKTTTNSASYMTFSPATGFSATNTANSGVRVKLWAVNYASPTSTNYSKIIYTPRNNSKTYDTDTNVLYYTGDKNSTTPATKYKYDMRSIASLDWSDNEGKAFEDANYAVKMASPTSYYYLNSKFWGVNLGLPNPGGSGTINVPDGSIGFTVQGASGGGTSKIYVIVATDPSQDINQEITVSRFGTGTNQDSDRSEVDRFVLPPVPGATTGATVPIVLTDGGTTYNTVYPNLNTFLVAYIFEVPIRTVAITYFLEASQGSASFVYLSSERSAAKDNNPFHDNDVPFPALNGVDYVFNGTNNVLATVTNNQYVQSLTSPYFGTTRNPSNLDGTNPNLDALIIPINTAYNFQYAINRAYNPGDQKYYLYIAVTVTAPSNVTGNTNAIVKNIIANYNYNFAEWSFLDQSNYEFVFSDVVVMNINGRAVDWSVHL